MSDEQMMTTQQMEAAGAGAAPSDFGNPSPFKKKAKEKDPLGTTVMAIGVIALIACFALMGLAMLMTA